VGNLKEKGKKNLQDSFLFRFISNVRRRIFCYAKLNLDEADIVYYILSLPHIFTLRIILVVKRIDSEIEEVRHLP
jgi:hypothetical protein